MNKKSEKHYCPIYCITVKGRIDSKLAAWFEKMDITYPGSDESTLRGKVEDQAALYGLLIKIRDLGLQLISVQKEK